MSCFESVQDALQREHSLPWGMVRSPAGAFKVSFTNSRLLAVFRYELSLSQLAGSLIHQSCVCTVLAIISVPMQNTDQQGYVNLYPLMWLK